MPIGNSAVLAGLPLFLGGIGCLCGGFLLRWATLRFGARRSRRAIAATGMMVAALGMLAVTQAPSAAVAIAAMGFAAFSNDLSLATCWTTCVDLGGRFAGTVGGQMNMWGAFGGFVSPMLIGWLLDVTGQNWNITFYICSAVYAAGALMWLVLDPVTPLEEPAPVK
jgi:nitrate/nitrite transporter NarK